MEREKNSAKRIGTLIGLLKEIKDRVDPPSSLLHRFQDAYTALVGEERLFFFQTLLEGFEIPKGQVEAEIRTVQQDSGMDPARWSRTLNRLRRNLESPRVRAFQKFMNLTGGLKFLLDLRADILSAQRLTQTDLSPLDEDIAHLFTSWFQQGFLFLQEITQDSPYRQIRFLKEGDLVHPMASLEEMGDRLGEDRRCFSLYHRAMPEEPVVFIEVALTRGIARSIHDIIGENRDQRARKADPDTAVFYSINNTQNGLAGLGLGKVLIFQVVEALKKTHPEIKTFSTLSPVPGFRERYLSRILKKEKHPFALNLERIEGMIGAKVRQKILDHYRKKTGKPVEDLGEALWDILSRPEWIEEEGYRALLRRPLTEITYFYLTEEKDGRGRPLNPVANFHLGNGAMVTIRNVNFGANRFKRGLEESCSMMVNYVYSMHWLQQIRQTMQAFLPWKA